MCSVLNKLITESTKNEKKRTSRLSTWTPQRRYQLKRLANNHIDGIQRKLAPKFAVSQQDI